MVYRTASHLFNRATRKYSSSLKQAEDFKQYFGKNHKRATRVYVWGNSRTGALGISKFLLPEKDGKRPVFVQSKPYNFHWPIDNGITTKVLASGCGFTVCGGHSKELDVHIYGFGINTDSQIGYHTENDQPVDYVIVPQQIQLPDVAKHSKLMSLACGRAHTVISTDKAVYTLGNNSFGQCGRPIIKEENYRTNRNVHKADLTNIVKVVCGHDTTFLLTDDGKVLVSGLGTDGQTGLGDFKCVEKFTELTDLQGVRVVDISCRCDTVLALTDKGEVFGWGNSEYGQFDMITKDPQLGRPTYLPIDKTCGKIKAVASAGTMCAVLNSSGELFVWGYGILGKGPNVQQSTTPEVLPMQLFGRTEYSPDVKIEKVACGINYIACINSIGNLYTWGKNTAGCLGLGHRKDQFFPFLVSMGAEVTNVSCGADHTVALCKAFV